MNIYSQIAACIIKEQQNIIGPLALREANKVVGLKVNSIEDISFDGDDKQIVGNLVQQYAKLFGSASIEICKEAVQPLISRLPDADVPEILKEQ